MRHIFKCVYCGEFFDKKGPEVLCAKCTKKPKGKGKFGSVKHVAPPEKPKPDKPRARKRGAK